MLETAAPLALVGHAVRALAEPLTAAGWSVNYVSDPDGLPVDARPGATVVAGRLALGRARAWVTGPMLAVPATVDELDAGLRQAPWLRWTSPAPQATEIVTRVEMLLEAARQAPGRIELADGWIDLATRRIHRPGVSARLTQVEADLVAHLAARAGEPVPRAVLKVEVLEYRPQTHTRALDCAVHRLRRKLEVDPASPAHLQTVRGRGYRWSAAAPAPSEAVAATTAPTAASQIVGLLDTRHALIGRGEARRAAVAALVSDRLAVLGGAPGVGKSRLALEAAAEWAEAHRCPVDVITREHGQTPRDIAAALARAWGAELPAMPEPVIVDALLPVLSMSGPRVIVADDCAVDDPAVASFLGQLVERLGALRLLVTSHRRPHDTMSGVRISLEPLSPEHALRMFWHCVRRVRPEAESDPGADGFGRRIVAATEGLPLAIELAAARLRIVPLATLAERLEAGIAVLQSRDPRLPPHHRSLANALEQAWSAVSDEARYTLRQVMVFRGGFGAEAAVAVCRPSCRETIDVLEELVGAHLLGAERDEGGLRFGLLEAVRRFVDRRVDRGEVAPARARHARYFAWFAAPAMTAALQQGDTASERRLTREVDNLRAAWSYALTAAPRDAVALSEPLMWALTLQGLWQRWADLVLDNAPLWRSLPPSARVWFVFRHAEIVASRSPDHAFEAMNEAIASSVAVGDRAVEAHSRLIRLLARDPGADDRAEVELALQRARQADACGVEARLLHVLAAVEAADGHPERCRALIERAHDLGARHPRLHERWWTTMPWVLVLIEEARLEDAMAVLGTVLDAVPHWALNTRVGVDLVMARADLQLGYTERAAGRLDALGSQLNARPVGASLAGMLSAATDLVAGRIDAARRTYAALAGLPKPAPTGSTGGPQPMMEGDDLQRLTRLHQGIIDRIADTATASSDVGDQAESMLCDRQVRLLARVMYARLAMAPES